MGLDKRFQYQATVGVAGIWLGSDGSLTARLNLALVTDNLVNRIGEAVSPHPSLLPHGEGTYFLSMRERTEVRVKSQPSHGLAVYAETSK